MSLDISVASSFVVLFSFARLFFWRFQVAVHVLDHALEFANPAASSLLPSVVPLLLSACGDQDPSVSVVSFLLFFCVPLVW